MIDIELALFPYVHTLTLYFDWQALVVGRRCDACAPAAYGFSSQGCSRCDCHYQGSQDEFCDQVYLETASDLKWNIDYITFSL